MPALIRLLTLLLGILYLDTVCQTDSEDARAYYARRIPEYVATSAAAAVVAPALRPTSAIRRVKPSVPASAWGRRAQRLIAGLAWTCPAGAPPPRRHWRRYVVLQV